jgi:hypothetical protein
MSLRTVAHYYHTPTAHIAAGYLNSYGIATHVHGENFANVSWPYIYVLGGIAVQVSQSDLHQARELLNLPLEPGWELCPSCTSDNIWRKKSLLTLPFALLLGVSAPFQTKRRICLDCRHKWKAEADEPFMLAQEDQ